MTKRKPKFYEMYTIISFTVIENRRARTPLLTSLFQAVCVRTNWVMKTPRILSLFPSHRILRCFFFKRWVCCILNEVIHLMNVYTNNSIEFLSKWNFKRTPFFPSKIPVYVIQSVDSILLWYFWRSTCTNGFPIDRHRLISTTCFVLKWISQRLTSSLSEHVEKLYTSRAQTLYENSYNASHQRWSMKAKDKRYRVCALFRPLVRAPFTKYMKTDALPL